MAKFFTEFELNSSFVVSSLRSDCGCAHSNCNWQVVLADACAYKRGPQATRHMLHLKLGYRLRALFAPSPSSLEPWVTEEDIEVWGSIVLIFGVILLGGYAGYLILQGSGGVSSSTTLPQLFYAAPNF